MLPVKASFAKDRFDIIVGFTIWDKGVWVSENRRKELVFVSC